MTTEYDDARKRALQELAQEGTLSGARLLGTMPGATVDRSEYQRAIDVKDDRIRHLEETLHREILARLTAEANAQTWFDRWKQAVDAPNTTLKHTLATEVVRGAVQPLTAGIVGALGHSLFGGGGRRRRRGRDDS